MRIQLATLALATVTLGACEPLEESRDVSGNFDISYQDNLRVYIGDELVAEVVDGEDATITWDGDTFQISTLCSDEGVECPSENYWGQVGIDQPWGPEYRLLNFANLDAEHGDLGRRLGGTLDDDGSFELLSGIGLAANGACAAIAVGTIEGNFTSDNSAIEDGVLSWGWAGGCEIDGVALGTSLRLETDFTAQRTGDLDLGTIVVEEPIDEDGAEVDPTEPDPSYE